MSSLEIDLGRPRYGLSRHLHGTCLEIGPGISPFPTPRGTTTILAERPFEGSIVELFPELGESAVAPVGDIALDLDTDGLRQFAPESLGSIVVSHVLEHVANPVQALVEMNRVLEPGGIALIALPDRRFTFDKNRRPTTVSHCFEEFKDGVRVVSDDHIIEFCQVVEGRDLDTITPELIEHHRKRSIHVHCWDAEEFFALLVFLANQRLISFDLVDFMGIEQSKNGADDEEFVFVLQKRSSYNSLELLLEQWADCIAGNRIVDVSRVTRLSNVLSHASSMLTTDSLSVGADTLTRDELLELWLSQRDLRHLACPLVDAAPMSDWARAEWNTDSRIRLLRMRRGNG